MKHYELMLNGKMIADHWGDIDIKTALEMMLDCFCNPSKYIVCKAGGEIVETAEAERRIAEGHGIKIE